MLNVFDNLKPNFDVRITLACCGFLFVDFVRVPDADVISELNQLNSKHGFSFDRSGCRYHLRFPAAYNSVDVANALIQILEGHGLVVNAEICLNESKPVTDQGELKFGLKGE
jgi:hypothetical protein